MIVSYAVSIKEESKCLECQPMIYPSIEIAIMESFNFMREIIPTLTIDAYKNNIIYKDELSIIVELISDDFNFVVSIVQCKNYC